MDFESRNILLGKESAKKVFHRLYYSSLPLVLVYCLSNSCK